MRIARALGLVLACALCAAAAPRTLDGPPTAAVDAAVAALRDGRVAQGRATLERLAAAGDASAIEGLGEVLQQGLYGVPIDRPAACRNFMRAAGQRGDITHNLALCYEQAVLGPADLPKAAQLYQRAADLGFQKSKCALGNFYLAGRGVAQDKARGLKLCTEAAEAGVADSQTDVGNVYLMGDGVPRDPVAARIWYEKAAAQNQANAAFLLGQIYWNGDGVKKDKAKAAVYWRIAYDHGRPDAAKMLGDEAYVRAVLGKDIWSIAVLDEARGWYEKGIGLGTPQMQAEAAERSKLTAQLKDVMIRQGKGR